MVAVVAVVVSSIALATIVIVSIVGYNKANTIESDYNSKMRNVVDQVNNAQYYEYEFDKKNKANINELGKNLDTVKTTYVTKDELAKEVNTAAAEISGTAKINQLKAHPNTYNEKIPEGWGGGIHSWDIYANGTVGAGTKGSVNAYLNSAGDIGAKKINSSQGISVTNNDPGPLIEKNYGKDADRYGVGQFPSGTTRLYAATAYPGSVNLSLAKDNNTFDDVVSVKPNRDVNITGPVKFPNNGTGLSWGNDYSKIYDNMHLHIETDDNMYMKAPNILSVQQANNNTINFTPNWQGTPDGTNNVSEISNDTNGYKTLMIVGNKSAGAERRVGIWDRLDVNGTFVANGQQYGSHQNKGDWGWRQYNANGGNVHMNHGAGYGLHVNTGNQEENKYALQLHNGAGDLFDVFNDGRQFGWNKNANDWGWRQFNGNGGNVHMNHGIGLGLHVNANNQDPGKYGLQIHNGKEEVLGVYNDKYMNINAKQVITNPNKGDWGTIHYNANSGNVHMNHGNGYGMHINTNNQEGGKYAMQLYNGKEEVLGVYNDKYMNINAKQVITNPNKGDWGTIHYNASGGATYMNHGAGHGMYINTNNQDGGMWSMIVNNGKNDLFRVNNDGLVNIDGANSRFCIQGSCINKSDLDKIKKTSGL
jgi:hypothetical protein